MGLEWVWGLLRPGFVRWAPLLHKTTLTTGGAVGADPLPSWLGSLGSVESSPSGVWGGAPVASEFCAFYFLFHAFWSTEIQISVSPRLSWTPVLAYAISGNGWWDNEINGSIHYLYIAATVYWQYCLWLSRAVRNKFIACSLRLYSKVKHWGHVEAQSTVSLLRYCKM